jgi:tRNA A-37 threonylcarbamoyl transferase component Bud32
MYGKRVYNKTKKQCLLEPEKYIWVVGKGCFERLSTEEKKEEIKKPERNVFVFNTFLFYDKDLFQAIDEVCKTKPYSIQKDETNEKRYAIASGTYGIIYQGEYKDKKQKIVFKVGTNAVSYEQNILNNIFANETTNYLLDSFTVSIDTKNKETITPTCHTVLVFIYLETSLFKEQKSKQNDYLSITIDYLKILKLVHSKNYVHRDISPGNLVVYNGKGMIIDFGAARLLQKDEIKNGVKYAGMGTPKFWSVHYMETGIYCFKDDLESLVYSIWFAINDRSLPFDTISKKKEMIQFKKSECKNMPNYLEYLLKVGRNCKDNEKINFDDCIQHISSLAQ